jgi:hypothetical protein
VRRDGVSWEESERRVGLQPGSTGLADSPRLSRDQVKRLREGGLTLDESVDLVLKLADDAVACTIPTLI